jgi:transaldolase / glucose-6-phosphate isomerase
MNRLHQLDHLGQSIWYDNISRSLLTGGGLKKMVEEGLLGVTSNPTIFDKAISGSNDYDAQISTLLKNSPAVTVPEVVQALMVEDVRAAADILRPVYECTHGRDGFVSIEVTPSKARDEAATILEVRELWTLVDRPNAMIKIPATREGLPAVTQAISEGINVNVTLIFSEERYREVCDAYMAGLERRLQSGKPLHDVASVASVFVSRIDTLVDTLLDERRKQGLNAVDVARLQGKAAVANAKLIYQAFREMFSSPRFALLQEHCAALQRPLWASTGTKNPVYSDLLYVEPLIGPFTVNTVPPSTYDAILDHCKPVLTLERELADARIEVDSLADMGVDIDAVLERLEKEGVAAFEKSFDGLNKNLQQKMQLLGTKR